MKAGNMLVLHLGILWLCTLEILANPVIRNLEKTDLSKLVDSELLSYIENNLNSKLKLKEQDNKEVRSYATQPTCKSTKKPEDCVIGDLILSPEDCEKLKKNGHF